MDSIENDWYPVPDTRCWMTHARAVLDGWCRRCQRVSEVPEVHPAPIQQSCLRLHCLAPFFASSTYPAPNPACTRTVWHLFLRPAPIQHQLFSSTHPVVFAYNFLNTGPILIKKNCLKALDLLFPMVESHVVPIVRARH